MARQAVVFGVYVGRHEYACYWLRSRAEVVAEGLNRAFRSDPMVKERATVVEVPAHQINPEYVF